MNIEKFKTWLAEQGAEILPTTNEWEDVRFKTGNGVSVVYHNAKGGHTLTNDAEKAYALFKQGKGWKVITRARQHLGQMRSRLASRDGGMRCFFCYRTPTPANPLTIEHLLNFSHGGSDNLNNLCLACKNCQRIIGRTAVTKKMEYYFNKRIDGLRAKALARRAATMEDIKTL